MGTFGINQVLEYSELNLDSWDATSDENPSGGSVYSWPNFYFTSRYPDVAAIKILSAEIPFGFYVINSSNNTFTYTEGATSYTITIAAGNYSGTTLASALQTAIAARSAGFTVTYASSTLLFTFTHNTVTTWSLYFAGRNTLYSFMGFNPNTLYSGSGVGSVITSVNVAQATGPKYLYLNSRKIGPFINFNLADGSPAGGDFPGLAKIPINTTFGNTIFYQDPDPEKYFDLFIGVRFDTIDFYFTLGSDQSQTPLDMRGVQWSLKLAILGYRAATDNINKKPSLSGSKVIGM